MTKELVMIFISILIVIFRNPLLKCCGVFKRLIKTQDDISIQEAEDIIQNNEFYSRSIKVFQEKLKSKNIVMLDEEERDKEIDKYNSASKYYTVKHKPDREYYVVEFGDMILYHMYLKEYIFNEQKFLEDIKGGLKKC